VKLLSFGADEESAEGDDATTIKKAIVRPDRAPSSISVQYGYLRI